MSDSSRPHGLQPTRLLCPWDFPSKSTGVGCHCLLRHKGLGVGNSTEVWSQRAGVKDFRQKSMKIVFLSSLQLWTTMTLFHWRFLKEHVKYPEKLSLPRMNARISLHQLLPLLECVCVCVCVHVCMCALWQKKHGKLTCYFLVGEAHLIFWSQWQMGWSWGVSCTIFQLFFFFNIYLLEYSCFMCQFLLTAKWICYTYVPSFLDFLLL